MVLHIIHRQAACGNKESVHSHLLTPCCWPSILAQQMMHKEPCSCDLAAHTKLQVLLEQS